MKNTFGNAITVTLFGESHGPAIGAVLDGLAPGIKIDREYIAAKLEQRKAKGKISTKRKEGLYIFTKKNWCAILKKKYFRLLQWSE